MSFIASSSLVRSAKVVAPSASAKSRFSPLEKWAKIENPLHLQSSLIKGCYGKTQSKPYLFNILRTLLWAFPFWLPHPCPYFYQGSAHAPSKEGNLWWRHGKSLWEDHYLYADVSPYHSQTSPHSLVLQQWWCLLIHHPLWSPFGKKRLWSHQLTSLLRMMKSVSQGIPDIHPASRNRIILSMKKMSFLANHLIRLLALAWHCVLRTLGNLSCSL